MDFSAYVADRRTRLARTAVLLGCPQADAEDVVQTALLRCFRAWRRVAAADHPDAYVHRVLVTTLAAARARRWNGELPTEVLPEGVDDGDPTSGIAVRRALAAMTPEHREVLVLRFYADLSEHDARTLLARAAATIDVAESAHLHAVRMPSRPVRTRRLGVLAAVAAVVVLVVGGRLLVGSRLGDRQAPVDRPTGQPVERAYVLDDDQVPSVLGYKRDEAVELLSSLGLEVRVREQPTACQPSGPPAPIPRWVLGFEPGDRVAVVVTSRRPVRDCVNPPPWRRIWELIRWARGLGGPLAFGPQVGLWAGSADPVVVTRADAADPDTWTLCDRGECHSALAAIEQMLTTPQGDIGHFASTFVVVRPSVEPVANGPISCPLTPDPSEQALTYRPPTFVWVDYPKDGATLCPPPPVIQIEWTRDGRIGGVGLRLSTTAEPGNPPAVDPVRARGHLRR